MTERAPKVPSAPARLSPEARKLWRDVVGAFELEAHHLALLERACEALDRLREAQAAIARDGLLVQGRYGPRTHPAAAIERDSRLAFARLLREIGLDLEAPAAPSRPPTRWRS